MADGIMGFIAGAIFSALIVFILTADAMDSHWMIKVAGHGYAHFDKDSTWHWNDEASK